ncbi:sialic acid-binding Ig-like lectin 5 [Ochotona princeps]|uniref:sialic acid-binding Ig-like lectin 5 n=1 Tax=Ochotona princeps TaxID=9978 RepID=UPI0027152B14|nr:sialic acid-binding Ig-like lectin 5 [Ochotona princeps]
MPRSLLLLLVLWAGSLAQLQSFWLEIPKTVTVEEGLCVSIPCRVRFYHPEIQGTFRYGSWLREEAKSQGALVTANRFREDDWKRPFRFRQTDTCSLNITDAQKSDTGSYFFTSEPYVKSYSHSYDSSENQFSLKVVALTRTPVILIPETLKPGHSQNITCEAPWACEMGTPPTFSWSGDAVSSLDPKSLHSPWLILNPGKVIHGANLTCRVTLPGAGVSTETTVRLSMSCSEVLATGPDVWVQEGQSVHLVCAADSNPPATLSWSSKEHSIKSRFSDDGVLRLPRVGLYDQGKYTCTARNELGRERALVRLFVKSSPQLLGPFCTWEAWGVNCTCAVRGFSNPSLHWRLGQRLLEQNGSDASFSVTSSSDGWTNSSLSLHGELSSDLRLSCEAGNGFEERSVFFLLLVPQGTPGSRAGQVLAALGGAGVTALLVACLCLLFHG